MAAAERNREGDREIMAMLNWNLGGKRTVIPGLTPTEQEDLDSEIEQANEKSFIRQQEMQAAQPRGLTSSEQAVAEGRSPSETLRLREEQRRDDWHKSNMKARQRRLEGMLATEGGRYSPIAIRRAQEELDRLQGGGIPGLRAHELAVADKGIEQERVKAWGLANQGGVAAGIKAGVERDANRSQHGYFDENGNYVPGSTVRAAEATGLSRTELENMRSENRMEQIVAQENGRDRRQQQQIEAGREKNDAWREEKGLDRQTNKEKADARTGRIKERQAQTDAMREQRDFEAFERSVGGVVNNPLTPEQKKEYRALKTPEERKAWWKSHFGREGGDRQPQDGKPKDGDRKQFKQGWGTWKNGKWVLDAQ